MVIDTMEVGRNERGGGGKAALRGSSCVACATKTINTRVAIARIYCEGNVNNKWCSRVAGSSVDQDGISGDFLRVSGRTVGTKRIGERARESQHLHLIEHHAATSPPPC